ncbi:ABC transporter permease [Chryseosolibacter indicus]|uniref:ABC transporter permease n=1 Tax=Chryseosolibacter indicus TaxID=2782351 RepID=A0ABS5VWA4_9BACT|nr:ABC transporter permease [Chryseosolibacter indicus]MBT1704281.1 ABC transporter permease [Chryseosolibacter indicus]
MLRNYLKTAFRNLARQKGTTLINVSGLTLGITCSLILFLLVKHLSSFDNYHTNKDRIYRVVSNSDGNNGKSYTPGVPSVLPDAFRNDFPEAEEVTFTSYRSGAMITIPQRNDVPKKYNEEAGVVFAQPNFFKIFDRKMLIGNATKGLDDPNEAIISLSLAKKYFGREDVIGEIVKYDTMEYKITGIMEDHPNNTDLPFSLMLSYITIKKASEANGWGSIWSDEHCYILLKEGEHASAIQSRIPAFVQKYYGDDNFSHQTFELQPLQDLHFNNQYETYTYSTSPKETLVALSIIAAFLIVTACINFINLTTAEAIKRSKEVGIRKSLGSTRAQLIAQFLGETTAITVVAMLLALGLTQITLSFLNTFLELQLALNFSSDGLLWAFIIGVTSVVALLSGLYPAFVISGYRPALALKNQIGNKNSSGYSLRRGLVVFQFVISQFLIIGTIVLVSQMNYFKKKELGFRKDAVVLVPIPVVEKPTFKKGASKMRTLREEVSVLPGVELASLSSTPPSSGSVSGTRFTFEGEEQKDRKRAQVKLIDGNYINLYDLKLIAGSGLEDLDTARGFLVNEQLLKTSQIENPQDIIGRKIRMWGKTLPVVGVVKNFHTVSLRSPIEPTIMLNDLEEYETLSLKVNPAQFQNVINEVKTKWEAAYPEHIFDYQFLDEHIREFYEGEERMSIMLTVFTSIAIFIGCLGLFGLATFMANQKTKEIGIRKVMGASVESIVVLFSKEFVKLIVLGFVIAAPLAWYIMNQYLNDFEYKITIGVEIFGIALGITLSIAVLTVGYKSLKAAILNPVKALRYE